MVRTIGLATLVMALTGIGLARGQYPGTPSTASAPGGGDRFMMVREPGKPDLKCKILKQWKTSEGGQAYQVEAVTTGERMTVVEGGPTKDGVPQSARIFSWGISSTSPPGIPAPPVAGTIPAQPPRAVRNVVPAAYPPSEYPPAAYSQAGYPQAAYPPAAPVPAAAAPGPQYKIICEPGQPDQKCKVLNKWTLADGSIGYEVESVFTGERMTVIESGSSQPGQPAAGRIFAWGPGQTPPPDVPLPPGSVPPVGEPIQSAATVIQRNAPVPSPSPTSGWTSAPLSAEPTLATSIPGASGPALPRVAPPERVAPVSSFSPVRTPSPVAGSIPSPLSPVGEKVTQEAADEFKIVQEPGRPPQKCKVIKTFVTSEGLMAYELEGIETGEKMTLVEGKPSEAMPESSSNPRSPTLSARIFPWGTNKTPPLVQLGSRGAEEQGGKGIEERIKSAKEFLTPAAAGPARAGVAQPEDWRQSWNVARNTAPRNSICPVPEPAKPPVRIPTSAELASGSSPAPAVSAEIKGPGPLGRMFVSEGPNLDPSAPVPSVEAVQVPIPQLPDAIPVIVPERGSLFRKLGSREPAVTIASTQPVDALPQPSERVTPIAEMPRPRPTEPVMPKVETPRPRPTEPIPAKAEMPQLAPRSLPAPPVKQESLVRETSAESGSKGLRFWPFGGKSAEAKPLQTAAVPHSAERLPPGEGKAALTPAIPAKPQPEAGLELAAEIKKGPAKAGQTTAVAQASPTGGIDTKLKEAEEARRARRETEAAARAAQSEAIPPSGSPTSLPQVSPSDKPQTAVAAAPRVPSAAAKPPTKIVPPPVKPADKPDPLTQPEAYSRHADFTPAVKEADKTKAVSSGIQQVAGREVQSAAAPAAPAAPAGLVPQAAVPGGTVPGGTMPLGVKSVVAAQPGRPGGAVYVPVPMVTLPAPMAPRPSLATVPRPPQPTPPPLSRGDDGALGNAFTPPPDPVQEALTETNEMTGNAFAVKQAASRTLGNGFTQDSGSGQMASAFTYPHPQAAPPVNPMAYQQMMMARQMAMQAAMMNRPPMPAGYYPPPPVPPYPGYGPAGYPGPNGFAGPGPGYNPAAMPLPPGYPPQPALPAAPPATASVQAAAQASQAVQPASYNAPASTTPPAALAAEQTTPQLLLSLRDALYPSQREWAAETLAGGEVKVTPQIIQALTVSAGTDSAATVRSACVRCLVKLKVDNPAFRDALLRLQGDPDPRVRKEAEQAISTLGAARAAP